MKIGTVGTSIITEKLIKAFNDNEVEVVACFSRSLEKANNFKEKFNISKMYTSYLEMLSDNEIDTVYIASPNSLHFTQAKEALKKGKNCIIEKPICTNIRELDELIDLANKKSLIIQEAMTVYHLPNYKSIRDKIANLGEVKMINATFKRKSSRYDLLKKNQEPNVFSNKFSGGCLMDINIYNVAFVTGLFGLPLSLKYINNTYNKMDTSGVAILKYSDKIAVCEASKDCNGLDSVLISGDNGYIKVNSQSSTITSFDLKVDGEFIEVIDNQEVEDKYYYEISNFKLMIDNKDMKLSDYYLEKTRLTLKVLDMLRENAGIVFDSEK